MNEPKPPSTPSPATRPFQGGDELPGAMIGRYKLLQQIGEGGFGTVWMAEQREPVQRKVALKIIKLGMDTRSVVTRFEAERQALAMMDHPNIARVYDGGATETGRPYFVMELVRGVPITQYCDDAKLSTNDRLVLFQRVCQAVQHAHQKGVIHRDLKPSNVLVGLHEGLPVPKVIDFGIAKATSGRLTERTMFTEYGQMIGTPEYMAPEQAETSGLDVDTRADVYSLGALLYELITGTKALELGDLLDKGYSAIMHQIREVDPPRPSTRISAMGARMTAIAERRRVVPHELGRVLRGDLDWIVMKALEKDRTRRYETAEALAQDIQRYFSNDPVLATPPSASYRLRKFARRNRGLVAAGSTIGLALVAGALASTLSLLRAREAEAKARSAESQARDAERIATERFEEAASAHALADRERSAAQASAEAARIAAAKAERVAEFTGALFTGITPEVARGADTGLMRLVLDRSAKRIDGEFAADPPVAAAMHYTVGRAYGRITVFSQAEHHLNAALEIQTAELGLEALDTLRTRNELAFLLQRLDRTPEALALANEVAAARERELGPEHRDTLATRTLVGNLLFRLHRYEESARMLRETAEISARTLGVEHEATLGTRFALAQALVAAEDMPAAEAILRDLVEIHARVSDEGDPSALNVTSVLASVLRASKHYSEAEPLFRTALERARKIYGPRHQSTLSILNNFALMLHEAGQYSESETLCREALEGRLATLGEGHYETLTSMRNLANLLAATQRLEEAEETARRAVKIARAQRDPDSLDTSHCLTTLGMMLNRRGNHAEATDTFGESARVKRKLFGDGDQGVWIDYYNWAAMMQNGGESVAAEPVFREMLDMWEQGGARDLPFAAAAWNGLAKCRMEAGDFDGMIAPFQRGLDMRRRLFTGAHLELTYSLGDYGCGLTLAGRYTDAEPLLTECLNMYEKLGVSKGGPLINVRALLAETMAAEELFDEAGAILTELDLAIAELDETVRNKHRRFVAKRACNVLERWNEAEPSAEREQSLAAWKLQLAAK